MLQPARRSAAEHEHHRRQHAGDHRPARAGADRGHRQSADQEMRVDQEIERAQRRRRIEQRVQHHQRREDQRLRIGDARMPAIVIRIPERRRAGLERGREEADRTRRTGSWNPTAPRRPSRATRPRPTRWRRRSRAPQQRAPDASRTHSRAYCVPPSRAAAARRRRRERRLCVEADTPGPAPCACRGPTEVSRQPGTILPLFRAGNLPRASAPPGTRTAGRGMGTYIP